jgi:membrane-associated phospholipid phosphatase
MVLVSVAFIGLAYTAHTVAYFPFDVNVTQAIQAVPMPWFHSLMVAVSWPGFPRQADIPVSIIAIGYYVAHRGREELYLVVSGIRIASLRQGVKILVNRPRPLPSLVHVLDPGLNGGKWSFPAGHVETYTVVLAYIGFLAHISQHPSIARNLVLLLTVVVGVLIGVSRPASGELWSSDMIGGYLFGSLRLMATVYFYRRGQPRAPDRTASARIIEPSESAARVNMKQTCRDRAH